MLAYFLSATLAAALGQAGSPAGAPEARKIDGDWNVVYIEMDGKPLESKDFAGVKIQNNKLTCRHEGKEKTFVLEFGPHHRVRAEETTPATTTAAPTEQQRHSHGVYIAAKDYLCFSMNHGRDTGSPANPAASGAASGTTGREHGAYGSHFVLILRRGGASTR